MFSFNVYASEHLRLVSKNIKEELDDFEVKHLTIHFILGVENLLKEILFEINPTFILKEPNFEHSIQNIYPERIIDEIKGQSSLPSKYNKDVITFQTAIFRSFIVSNTCLDNKNLLFNLSNARDILIDNKLIPLKIDKLKLILQRDFYTFIKSIAKEIKMHEGYFMENSIKLMKLSRALQTDLENKMRLLIEEHERKWGAIQGSESWKKRKIEQTKNILQNANTQPSLCPACKNDAYLDLNPVKEYNPYEKRDIIIGYEIEKLKCEFCTLSLQDSAELDHFNIKLGE